MPEAEAEEQRPVVARMRQGERIRKQNKGGWNWLLMKIPDPCKESRKE
jgi:hypothetical protein